MIGEIDFIDSDAERMRQVRLRVPSRSGEDILDVQIHECIGKGSFGTVYRAVLAGYPSVALKVTTGKPARLQQELEVLSKVCTKGHLHLPRFEFGALSEKRELLLIGMELCVPSTLHDLLLTTRIPHEADMLFMGYQATQAVACVHSEGCIHRDVKLQNFVFDISGNLKLIDFGLASTSVKPPAGDIVAGTVSFMAPEMAHNALHKEKRLSVGISADLWSLGIVLYSIFTQRNPYTASEEPHSEGVHKSTDLLQRVAAADWHWPPGCQVSPPVRELISSLLVRNAADRPTIEAVLQRKVWSHRRRTPPAALTAFLGVQDDLFHSADESLLMRAVAAKETPSVDLTEGGEPIAPGRSSLKVVTKDQVELDGSQHVTAIYDVRGGNRRQSKPLRDIDHVIRDASLSLCRSKKSSDRPASASASRKESLPCTRSSSARGKEGGCPIAERESAQVNTRIVNVPEGRKRQRSPRGSVAEENAPLEALMKREALSRALLSRTCMLEQQWLLVALRLILVEDQERYTLTWLEEEQRRSTEHPHHFAVLTQAAKGNYRYGFVCDMCLYEYEPKGMKHFSLVHCKCGRDLCTDCYTVYKRKCTCLRCLTVLPNEQALHKHLTTNECQMQGRKSPRSVIAKPSTSAPKRAPNLTKTNSKRPPKKLSIASMRRDGCSEESKDPEELDVDQSASPGKCSVQAYRRRPTHVPTASSTEASSSSASARENSGATLRISESVDAPPAGEWKPFASLRSFRNSRPPVEQPTEQEKLFYLQGPWVQNYYVYPPGEPDGSVFVYQIQPHRTGAMFLEGSLAGLHSAVFSQMERLFFVVENLDLALDSCETNTFSLIQAKANPRLAMAFDIMEGIIAYDSNIRKQHRIPGTSAVYQAPRSSYNARNDPVIFVRWFRVTPNLEMTALSLSNGAVQVLVHEKYELRFYDRSRIILLRADGVCEVVDERSEIMTSVYKLLYEESSD